MAHASPAAAVVLAVLTLGFTDASILCTWTKVLSSGEVHLVFVRSEPTRPPRLYHSVRSSASALLDCSFSDDTDVIRKYTSLCRGFPQNELMPMTSDSELAEEEQLCVSVDSAVLEDPSVSTRRLVRRNASPAERSGVKTNAARVKRGFIVPGTLWCGSGNRAPSYSDLGVFSKTDICCREHDQCQDTILSFHSKFGVFNSNIFTMSHCDCDNRFHRCLKEAQNSVSDVVGYTFFNLLKMHCFDFSYKLQCVERNWFGMCKESKMALYAEVHPPTLYVTDSADVNVTGLNSTNITVHDTSPPATTESTAATHSAHTSLITPTSTSMPVTAISAFPPRSPHQSVPEPDADVTEKGCAVYKYLDKCRNRIPPLQKKYGFRNNEPRTMYHCHCTDRLFQSLAAHPAITEVHALLLEHVSQSCFVLQDCTSTQFCTVEVRTRPSQVQAHSSSSSRRAYVNEQHHLQAMRLKVRRPTLKRATNHRSARLYRLCLRTLKHQVHKGRRRHTKEPVRKEPE